MENYGSSGKLEWIMSIFLESRMKSWNVTRLNIPVTHLLRLWMEKTGMIGSWSQDPGLVSKHITKIDKIIKSPIHGPTVRLHHCLKPP